MITNRNFFIIQEHIVDLSYFLSIDPLKLVNLIEELQKEQLSKNEEILFGQLKLSLEK